MESRKGFWWKIFCFKQQAKKMSLSININKNSYCSHCNVLHLSMYGFGVHCWIVPKDDSSCYNINLLHQVINIVDEFNFCSFIIPLRKLHLPVLILYKNMYNYINIRIRKLCIGFIDLHTNVYCKSGYLLRWWLSMRFLWSNNSVSIKYADAWFIALKLTA